MNFTEATVERLSSALSASSYSYTSGKSHNFYHYPARFSPSIAEAVIETFSAPGDLVLDPFMGGGTAIIEGLALGRRMLGMDINALAHFVARVRTTPLSPFDSALIRRWAIESANVYGGKKYPRVERPQIHNLPSAVNSFISGALEHARCLPFPRQQAFARCALLRLGQWALDCRDFVAPRRQRLAEKLPELVDELLEGLDELTGSCRIAGIAKNEIIRNRLLLHRSAVGLHLDDRIPAGRPVQLVFTSPPYPSVHVLYHRWQYRGRKETPAPYWIANVSDGYDGSYYTGGSRTPTGRRRYFEMITAAFKSVRNVLSPNALVVQLIGFSDMTAQLPRYLEAMDNAGFDESLLRNSRDARLDRRVPNRKWYAKLKGAVDSSCELLLFHRPRRSPSRN
jgi:DNA modification methylase